MPAARVFACMLLVCALRLAAPAQRQISRRGETSAKPTGATLQARILSITQEPAVARAHWGVSVTTMQGTPLVAIHADQYFQPASNAKLFTTAAALALLPVQDTLKTNVIATGYFRPGGLLEGDLTLRGVGDPNLSGRPVPYQPRVAGQPEPPRDELRYIDEIADEVKASGITAVHGDVIGDDSLWPWNPYPPDWAMDDAPWYYGAPINALMIADNAVTLTITPGTQPKPNAVVFAQASFTPALPFYALDVQAKTVAAGGGTHLDIQRRMGERTVHVYGTIAADAQPYVQDMSIADPAEYAALALKAALLARGVVVDGAAKAKHLSGYFEPSFSTEIMKPVDPLSLQSEQPTRRIASLAGGANSGADWTSRVVATHTSAPWVDDIAITNKTSQNQHAELWLRQLGFWYGLGGTTLGGERVLRTFLTTQVSLDPDDFVFYDGSGLSGHDLVTPRAITTLLRYGATQPWGNTWKASLPIGGVDGSLRNRFTEPPLRGHVFAKTGTLGEARALSGYLQCASGRTVAFSVMVTTHSPLNNDDQHAIDRIVAAIAAAE